MSNKNKRSIIAFVLIISGLVLFSIGVILNNIFILLLSIPYSLIVVIIILAKIYPFSMIKENMRQWANTKSITGSFTTIEHALDYSTYREVTKTYSRNKPFYLIILSLVSIVFSGSLILFGKDLKDIFFMIVWIIVFIYQIYLLIFETITISPKGIGCKHWLKNYFIKWEDIVTAGFTLGQGGVPEWPFGSVYVTKNKLSKDMYGISKSDIKNGYIFFQYRPKIVHHMMANYQKSIRNIEMVESWKKYIKKNCIKRNY